MSVLKIEDDDGFTTEWPWPDKATALANAAFVAILEDAHNMARKEAGLDG